jgi:uncharacterized membrane protein
LLGRLKCRSARDLASIAAAANGRPEVHVLHSVAMSREAVIHDQPFSSGMTLFAGSTFIKGNSMETQGKIFTAAALAAGGALLLARQMRNTRSSGAAYALERSMEEVGRRPGRFGTFAALAIGGLLLSNQMKRTRALGSSSSVEESIEVNVPVSTAYNQWTQFEEFPRFMDSVQEVKQLDNARLHWRANVAGKTKEWDAEITEQIPDQRIAWRSIGGVRNEGVVTFNKISDNKTRIVLHMDYQPETAGEKIGDAVGGVKLTAKGNLKRFKDLIEGRGVETGAWRGTITQH